MIAIIISGAIFCLKIWLIKIGIKILMNIVTYAQTDYPDVKL